MKKIILFAIVLLSVLVSTVFAAEVLDMGSSVRSIALGRAYAAMGGGATSIFANPAAIGFAEKQELSSMYGDMGGGDVKFTMIGSVIKTKFGNLGIGYAGNFGGDLLRTTLDATTGRPSSVESFSYMSSSMMVGYGGAINDKIAYGIRGKYVKKGSPDLAGADGIGINADLGLLAKIDDKLQLGLTALNVIRGDMGSINWIGYREEMPFAIDMGFEYKRNNIKFYGDLSGRNSAPMAIKFGGEWNAWKNLYLRAGIDQGSQGVSETYYDYSAGIGYEIGDIKLDYAYYRNGLDSSLSQHFISLAMYLPGM